MYEYLAKPLPLPAGIIPIGVLEATRQSGLSCNPLIISYSKPSPKKYFLSNLSKKEWWTDSSIQGEKLDQTPHVKNMYSLIHKIVENQM